MDVDRRPVVIRLDQCLTTRLAQAPSAFQFGEGRPPAGADYYEIAGLPGKAILKCAIRHFLIRYIDCIHSVF